MPSKTRGIWLRAGLVAVTTLAACNGDGGQGGSGPNPGPLAIQEAGPTGNNQAGPAGGDLPLPVRIVALRDGAPAAGAVILWSATGIGGFMKPSVDTTGADGISTSIWHLGNEPGPQSAQASVAGGAAGSPVSFIATAVATGNIPPGVTIQLRSSGGNRFEPANVTIPSGTTVTWTWVDGFHNVTHDVLSGGNRTLMSSGAAVSPPESYSFTFTTPGTYSFFCEVHGTLTTGMHGTVVVQ